MSKEIELKDLRLADMKRVREDARVEFMNEIRTMTNRILQRAQEAGDTGAVELIEKYILPVVNEHQQAAKTDQQLQPSF